MHNGNLRTLEDVLAHYNSLDDNELIDANLKKGTTLNAEETKQLIAFLNTLTDYEFIVIFFSTTLDKYLNTYAFHGERG